LAPAAIASRQTATERGKIAIDWISVMSRLASLISLVTISLRLFGQSGPGLTLNLAESIAAQGVQIDHLDRLAANDNSFTFFVYPGKSSSGATLVRVGIDGQVLWKTPLGADEASDLVLTPSGGVDVLLTPASTEPVRLVHYDASGKLVSSEPVGEMVSLCRVGDRVFGLNGNGAVERMSDHAEISRVPVAQSGWHVVCLGADSQDLVVLDVIEGVLHVVNVVTGVERTVAPDDADLAGVRERYKEERQIGITIMAATPFHGGILALLSGFPASTVPLLTIDLNGHTTATKRLSLASDSGIPLSMVVAFIDKTGAGELDVLGTSGAVTTFAIGSP
jgi:hypothetical protein